jgi:hypothetical protein
MNDIIDHVLLASEGAVSEAARQKVADYLTLLASTGKTKPQLIHYGAVYVKEMLKPDSRYSGL